MSKITKIEMQKRNKDRYNLYIDDKFFMGISEDTLINLNLYKDKKIMKEDLEKLIIEEEYSKAYSYSLYFLGFRMRSEKEIRDKLKEKEYTEIIIDDVVEKLKEFGYVNDYLFSEALVRTRINSNKYGINRIKNDLRNKGIQSDIINNVISDYFKDNLEYKICYDVIINNKHKYKKDEIHKTFNFLSNRGFTYQTIKNVIDDLSDLNC